MTAGERRAAWEAARDAAALDAALAAELDSTYGPTPAILGTRYATAPAPKESLGSRAGGVALNGLARCVSWFFGMLTVAAVGYALFAFLPQILGLFVLWFVWLIVRGIYLALTGKTRA